MADINNTIRELVSGQDWKASLDTLIMFVNKPVNYETLQNLRRDFFLVAVREFIKQRHEMSGLEVENTIAKVQDSFKRDGVDLFTFQGLKLPVAQTLVSNTGQASSYYALEEYFQYTLYDACQEKIKSLVMDTIRSLTPF